MGRVIDRGLLTPDSDVSLGGLSLSFVRRSKPSTPTSSESPEPEPAQVAQSETPESELEDVRAKAVRHELVGRLTASRESKSPLLPARDSSQSKEIRMRQWLQASARHVQNRSRFPA